jgi:hypothetical protein
MSPKPSPYAPPRAPIASAGTVDANKTQPLPPICVKCGSTHEISSHPKTLMVVGRARPVTLAVALVAGVTVVVIQSATLRTFFFFAMAGVALLVRRFVYARVDLAVPLCATCAHRWAAGIRWSQILRGGIIVLVLANALAVLAALSPLVTIVLGLGVFAAAIALLLLRMRSRIIVAQRVAGDVVTLALVHPDAVSAIVSARASPAI